MLVSAVAARETYRVEIEGVARDLPLFEVAPGLRGAVFNILGDTEIVEASARGLARRLGDVDHDVLVAGGDVVAEGAVFTEGDERETEGIVSLGHLPLFPDSI
jgi:hypothetical protein